MPNKFLLLIAFLSISLALSGSVITADEPSDDEAGFTPLFDGETLEGWEGDAEMFRVADGAIVAGTQEARIPHNYFLCTTEEYGDYELRYEARLLGEGHNAGVQFRSRRIPNHHEVRGYQCDMGESTRANNQYIWGSLYDEKRRNRFLAEGDNDQVAEVLNVEGWNEFIIRCEGPRVQIWLNGYQTVDFTEDDNNVPRSGIIGLQIHGGAPAEASYRNIRICPLGDQDDNPSDTE